MWKDTIVPYSNGTSLKESKYQLSKEFLKGGRTKYNVEICSDLHNPELFRVRCPEVELKRKALKSSDFEAAKKEALELVVKKLKEKVTYLNSLVEVFENELKK